MEEGLGDGRERERKKELKRQGKKDKNNFK